MQVLNGPSNETVIDVDRKAEQLDHNRQETSVRERIRFWGNFISAWISVLAIIASIIFYILDVATDLQLAYNYYVNGGYLYFGLTLSFVIIPYLISLIVSGLVYKEKILSTSTSWQRLAWLFYVLTLPISRSIRVLHGIGSAFVVAIVHLANKGPSR